MPLKDHMKWNCSTDVQFYSHKLDKTILDHWNNIRGKNLNSPILFHYVDEHLIKLQFYLPEKIPFEDVGIRSNMITISSMVALNLADPGGHIWWPSAFWPVRFTIEENWRKIGVGLPYRPFIDRVYRNDVVDEKMLRRFEMLIGATAHTEATLFYHYVKAMNLLSSPSPEVKFYEEIFINLWKCIERFIAVEIRKDKKPVNRIELILESYKALGDPVDDGWLEEVKKLYILRGNTIAHSYGKEELVTFEELGKCKLFADFLMYAHLIKLAESEMKKMRDEKIPSPSLQPAMKPVKN